MKEMGAVRGPVSVTSGLTGGVTDGRTGGVTDGRTGGVTDERRSGVTDGPIAPDYVGLAEMMLLYQYFLCYR